jgi:hypothetical protein
MRVVIVRRSAGSTRLPISSKSHPALPFESVFKIAQPPIASLVSVIGLSVTVILPLASRTRTPSLLFSPSRP